MTIALLCSGMTHDSNARIAEGLRSWIRTAPPGARLPSTRHLVTRYSASPVTVQKAVRSLSAEGLIESRPGSGNFVRVIRPTRHQDFGWQTAALRTPRSRIPRIGSALDIAPPDAQALHSGYPDRQFLPERLVRTALARAARGAAATSRPPAAGLQDLRSWFASQLADATRGDITPANPNDVLIVPGSQSGLVSIFRAVVAPGESLLIESPTYWGAILAAHQAGIHLVPVPSDIHGPDPAELDRSFRETGARAVYAQPNFANPTGAQWAVERGEAILEVVRSHRAFVVEDDWASDFGIDTHSRPLAANDETGHVIYIRSVTKSMSPTLRVGAVVARGPVRDRVLADRAAESMYVSPVLQHATLEVATDPAWRTHLRRLRQLLRDRRDLLVESLRAHAPAVDIANVPPGGLHLWARLPDATDLDGLVRDCAIEGVWIASGNEWFPAEPSAPHLRLNFTGPNPAGYQHAAQTIARALAQQT